MRQSLFHATFAQRHVRLQPLRTAGTRQSIVDVMTPVTHATIIQPIKETT
jgi:hypothetical protein